MASCQNIWAQLKEKGTSWFAPNIRSLATSIILNITLLCDIHSDGICVKHS